MNRHDDGHHGRQQATLYPPSCVVLPHKPLHLLPHRVQSISQLLRSGLVDGLSAPLYRALFVDAPLKDHCSDSDSQLRAVCVYTSN